MPWKNGQGETLEVARSPDGSSLEAFDWRVSVAPVVSDGAFSIFPGIERTIAVIEGAGMELTLAGERTHRLLPGMPFTYDGGLAIDGRLIDGPVRDFNVMARRGRCTGELMLAAGPIAVAGAGATIVAFALEGAWRMTVEAEVGRLEPGGSVTTGASMLSADPRSPGARLAIALLRFS
jgi:hypothetical protein